MNHHKLLMALAAVLALFFGASSVVLASEDNTIVMGVYDAPPNIIRENGRIKGISSQYIKVIEMVSDLEVALEPMPYSRLVFSRASEDVDMVNAFVNAELEQNAEILTRTGRVKAYLVTLEGVDLFAKPPSENVSVGITRGLRTLVKAMDPPAPSRWNIVGLKDEQHGLRAVMLGRLDGMYVTDIAYDYFTDLVPEMKATNFKTHKAGLLDIYLWTRKGESSKPKYQRLKKIVDRMSFNGNLPVKWWDISDFLDFISNNE